MSSSNAIQHPLDLSGGNAARARGSSGGGSYVPRTRRRRGVLGAGQRQAPSPAMGGGGPSPGGGQSSADAKRKRTRQLPRSVRWRLSLGLLTRPSDADDGDGQPNKESILRSVEELNALRLRYQRSRYEELERKHYWKSTPVGIASDEASNGGASGSGTIDSSNHGGSHVESLHQVAPGDDPLTSPLAAQKSKTDDKKWGIFGGSGGAKERGFMKSPSNPLTSSFNSTASSKEGSGDEAACKGSRWADFYSTREVLDVIDKDLNRLPSDHYSVYHEWRIKNKGWKEHRQKEEQWRIEQLARDEKWEAGEGENEEDSTPDLPVSTMKRAGTLGEMHSTSRNQKKLSQSVVGDPSQKQNWTLGQSMKMGFGALKGRANSVDDLTALMGLDEEDPEEAERKREEKEQAEIQTSIKERAARISQILFVYAREHPEIGYRQGMHEVLSFILLALEADLLEGAIVAERLRWRRNSLSFGLPAPSEDVDGSDDDLGAPAGLDSSGNVVRVRLLDPEGCLSDAFGMFEHVMTALAPAYDAVPADDEVAAALLEEAREERGESPMEAMTASIVSKIRFVARDEKLFGHILYMPVPPQLYFAKWIRLMFGREVAGGTKSVMTMWGAFFDLASAKATSKNEELSLTMALLDVLKTAAAGMILLIRNNLLAPTVAPDGTMTGEPDPNVGIGYLMNYPPLNDIGTLVEMISNLISRERKISSDYHVAKERKLSKQYLPSENYMISSIIEHPLQENDSDDHLEQSPPRNTSSSQLNKDVVIYRNGQGGEQQREEFLQKVNHGLPQVYRTGGGNNKAHATLPPQHQHHDVSESIGNIAEGLLHLGSKTVDFGAKTASAAMASFEKQIKVHTHSSMDHPLAQGDHSGTGVSGTPSQINTDYVFDYRPYTPAQKKVEVTQLNIGEKLSDRLDTRGEEPDEEEISDEEIESIGDFEEHGEGSDDEWGGSTMDQSMTSKLSISKIIGDSVHKTPTELASLLERSVATLMIHFNEQLSNGADTSRRAESPATTNGISDSQHSSSSIIPENIWNAMADIDLVRKELMSQAAIAGIDHGRSNVSLRSSNRSRTKAEGKRPSWQL